MKVLQLSQGSPEWHAHRIAHRNSSEASIMLGAFPNVSRSDLLEIRGTGIERDIDSFLQRIFDDGHRFEALARPLAEKIIGEELYPCVGVLEGTKFSASFDGLTLLGDVNFEHKTLNNALRDIMTDECTGADLPIYYQIQMEQQSMVSDAAKTLFMASEWDGDSLVDERHCWYTPNPELRARIVAGWEQFERDVADYKHEPKPAPAPIGRAPETLPSLRVEAQGMVTFSNLAEFRASAMTVLGAINRELKTDDDFADADKTVKWCHDVESRLEATKSAVLAQMRSVDEVCRTIDDVSAETRRVRLELDRLVKAEKESRRGEIVASGVAAVRQHYDEINATLGEHAMRVPPSVQFDVGAAIKGKKTLTSIRDGVDSAVAAAKIAASQNAERIRKNMAILAEHADHASLFADRVMLCESKTPDDLRNLVAARIAAQALAEAARIEIERAKIRAEELARLALENAPPAEAAKEETVPVATVSVPSPVQHPVATARPGAKISLGQINERIAPLSISAQGLESLGFNPLMSSGKVKLYAASDFCNICTALTKVISTAKSQSTEKAA